MGWLGRTLLGLALMAAGLALTGWAVYELTEIGTCASGGPYEIARECPDNTVLYGIAIFPGVIAFLAGGWLFVTRGRARGVEPGLPPDGGDELRDPRVGRSW